MLPLTPAQKQNLFQKARAFRAEGKTSEAITALTTLLKSEPTRPELHLELSQAAFDHCDTELCLSALQSALDLAPDSAKLWLVAAARYQHFRMTEKALAAYDRAIKLDPKALTPRIEKTRYQQMLGDFDTSEKSFRKILKRHPEQTDVYRIFLGTTKLGKGDPLIRQMQKLWVDPRLNDTGRTSLGYALAKAMEDTGARDKMFGYLHQANAAQRRSAPFDATERRREWRAQLEAQDGLPTEPLWPEAKLAPVFVCGMPRSGTTLVEQIIAAHSQAVAGGEQRHSLQKAVQLLGRDGALTPLAGTSKEKLAEWADAYLRLVHRDTGAESGVVTDKSIQSHRIFGLIRHALPGAKLIVVHRDPRDIALSIYKNHFATGAHRYANDLADIAGEIRLFRDSVAHWKARLPGVIHEVRYEELVADPETQARALVAAAGLDWEDACLRFHEAKGAVQTLSLAQVRQPIHAGRRAAWRAYEAELQPFIEAWGDNPWD